MDNARPQGYETERSLLLRETVEKKPAALVAQPAERRFRKAFSSEDYIFSFRKWLIAQGKRYWTVREIVIFAKKYGHVLDNGDASELMTLSSSNRKHALSALAALSKYHGRYDQYLQLNTCSSNSAIR